MQFANPSKLTGFLLISAIDGALTGLVLIIYGWMLSPGASLLNMAGPAAVLVL